MRNTTQCILAGDIGGTKTRLAIFETGGAGLETLREETFPSRAYDGLEQIAGEFLERGADCDLACFGVAGPVRAGRCRTTNLPWEINAESLRQALGMRQVTLLNDLEANAWGISALGPEDFATLNPGASDASGNAAVIAAGQTAMAFEQGDRVVVIDGDDEPVPVLGKSPKAKGRANTGSRGNAHEDSLLPGQGAAGCKGLLLRNQLDLVGGHRAVARLTRFSSRHHFPGRTESFRPE